MKLFTLAIPLSLVFIGCVAPQAVFVVQRDVPENPSFVVIPANYYLSQVAFANKIVSYLIQCRVKVIEPPTLKEVQATKELGQIEGAPSQATGAQLAVTETYAAYDSTVADYIVWTDVDYNQIKILRKTTKEILAVFQPKEGVRNVSKHEVTTELDFIRTTLDSLGIKTR
jgi:hypothetical protein